jgi:hypothetical protein
LNDLGLEKLGEVRTSIRGHLSGEAELADRDLAIYVKARDGRKTAFQRALEENLKDLGERPPFERGTPTKVQDGGSRPQAPSLPESSVGEPAGEVERIDSPKSAESLSESPESGPSKVKSVTFKPALPASSDGGVQSTSAREQSAPSLPRMEPLPLLTAALEAVGFAEDEFGFVLRYGRYAQPGRNSEFLVGGLGLSDLSDRLAGWLEAQGANNCEVQVLDEGSGELKIYLLGHDRPLALPEAGIELT